MPACLDTQVLLGTHVDRILVEEGSAKGVVLRRGGKTLRARKGVVSNASIWDTRKLLPNDLPEDVAAKAGASDRLSGWHHKVQTWSPNRLAHFTRGVEGGHTHAAP